MNETFGEEVRRRRLALTPKVSQAKLAELSSISTKVVADMERGSRNGFQAGTRLLVSNALDKLEADSIRVQRQSTQVREEKKHSEFGMWLSTTGKILGFKNMSELARAFGVNQASVSRWCSGASAPTVGHLVRISDLFGVDLKALLAMSGHITPEQAGRSLEDPTPRPVVPEGAIAASIDDVLSVLHGPIADPEAFMSAAKRLHLACLVDAEIIEEVAW